MSKEIYISSTPHETRLAIVENEELSEIYYERENEYTLAGSIYNGRVTRVLPGMQSSFVDIGLERDAFLYVTDFMEEQGEAADFEADGHAAPRGERRPPREAATVEGTVEPRGEGRESGRDGRRGRRGDRGRNRHASDQQRMQSELNPAAAPVDEDARAFAEAQEGGEFGAPRASAAVDEPIEDDVHGSRRWRGRRGRRRGRGSDSEAAAGAEPVQGVDTLQDADTEPVEPAFLAQADAFEEVQPQSVPEAVVENVHARSNGLSEGSPAEASSERGRSEVRRDGGRDRGGRDRGGRDRGGRDRGGRDRGGRGDGRRDGRDRDSRESGRSAFAAPFEENLPEAPAEPVILPGESLGKYRAGGDAEPERAAASPVAPVVDTFVAAGWDGSAVLPGETIRPRNRGNDRGGERGSQRDSARHLERATVAPFVRPQSSDESDLKPKIIAAEDGPAVESVPVRQPEVLQAAEPASVPSAVLAEEEATSAPEPADVNETAAKAEETSGIAAAPSEYEPQEGASAGHAEDASRRDYRRGDSEFESEVIVEEAGAAEDAAAEEAVGGPETHAPRAAEHDGVSSHAFTTIQPTGEMLSEFTETHEQTQQDLPHAAAPIEHEGAVQSVALSEAEGTPAPHVLPQTFAFGDGDLHEEVIDEEEFEFDTLSASDDDGDMEEMEEETLEGAADLGTMLREMSIDGHTHREDGEDAVDDGTETEFEEEGAYEVEEQPAAPASEESDAPHVNGNGYERPARREPRRGGGDRGGRRDGRRDGRGGDGRSGGRGRGRQSVQATDLPAINELLKPGQEILVQIAKEPIAKKGARITSHIALPGRFLVFMPTVNHTGVSRKISSDEERRRLKSILLSEKGEASGGFIVRTAAEGASEEELRSDLRFLINLWTDIKTRSESSKSPALIYHDLNLVERILRDQVGDNFSAIWVDTESEYERVLRFLQRFQPSLIRRVKLYTKETPLFEQFGITTEIDKALKSKVWLKSGGSIVINQTEALVAIDINTGKFVGKTARLEDTILKTNLDAIPEIVRQIRLRDLGGIIVIDFIDMDERKNRARVLQAMEDELKLDRAPSKVLPFNDFGLVVITRKRVKQSLERTLSTQCNVCTGTGMVKSPVTVANEIYIEMRKMHKHLERNDIMLRVHPEVVKQLKVSGSKWLQEMEEMTRKTILVKSDPSLNPEQFDIH